MRGHQDFWSSRDMEPVHSEGQGLGAKIQGRGRPAVETVPILLLSVLSCSVVSNSL